MARTVSIGIQDFEKHGKKVIILLDEYDTPMQEAYVNGCWREMVGFIRSFFNSTPASI